MLLVGFPPLMLSGLEPALARVAEVVSVPFPGTAFDRAAEEFDPDMVVVNVTYLDQAVIQPLIAKIILPTFGGSSVRADTSAGTTYIRRPRVAACYAPGSARTGERPHVRQRVGERRDHRR